MSLLLQLEAAHRPLGAGRPPPPAPRRRRSLHRRRPRPGAGRRTRGLDRERAPARAGRDGIDMTGSDYGGPGLVYPDVETVEQTYPVLYLYKRLRPDAGGAGRFRGGASVDAAFVLHGTDGLEGTTLGMRKAVPLPGLFGGYPGACTLFELRQDTTLGKRLVAGGGLPTESSEIDGRAVGVGLNAAGIRLGPGE